MLPTFAPSEIGVRCDRPGTLMTVRRCATETSLIAILLAGSHTARYSPRGARRERTHGPSPTPYGQAIACVRFAVSPGPIKRRLPGAARGAWPRGAELGRRIVR